MADLSPWFGPHNQHLSEPNYTGECGACSLKGNERGKYCPSHCRHNPDYKTKNEKDQRRHGLLDWLFKSIGL